MADAPLRYDLMSGYTGNLIQITVGGRQAFVVDYQGNLSTTGKISAGAGINTTLGGAPVTSSLDAHLTSATVSGNDEAGIITLVFDATGSSASVALCTVTFSNATLYSLVPTVIVTNQTQGAASTTTYASAFGVSTVGTTSFKLVNGATASTASSTYVVGYQVIGRG